MLLEGRGLIKDEDYVRYYPRTLTYVLSCNRNLPFSYPAASLLTGIPLEGPGTRVAGFGSQRTLWESGLGTRGVSALLDPPPSGEAQP